MRLLAFILLVLACVALLFAWSPWESLFGNLTALGLFLWSLSLVLRETPPLR